MWFIRGMIADHRGLIKEVAKDPESHAHESPPAGTNVKDPALRNLRAFNSHCVAGYP